jgi:hypothetical protein
VAGEVLAIRRLGCAKRWQDSDTLGVRNLPNRQLGRRAISRLRVIRRKFPRGGKFPQPDSWIVNTLQFARNPDGIGRQRPTGSLLRPMVERTVSEFRILLFGAAYVPASHTRAPKGTGRE